MKVLIMNGSPRYKSVGNLYAEKYASFLQEEAQKYGQDDIVINTLKLAKCKLNYCVGKLGCFKVGKCPLDRKDDMGYIKEQMATHDHIIMIIPVYSHNVPGIVKTMFDRLSYNEHFFGFAGKKLSILVQSDSNGTDETIDYVAKICLVLGFQLVNVSGLTALEIMHDNDIFEGTIHEHVERIIESHRTQEIIVDEYQEQLFRTLRMLILEQEKKGHASYKIQRWTEIMPHDTLRDYIATKS